MATTTVVCPECGAAAAPGRFACPECGALVASLGAIAKPARAASRRASRRTAAGTKAGDPGAEAVLGETVADEAVLDGAAAVAPVEPFALEPDDERFDAAEPVAQVPDPGAEPQWPSAPVEPRWPSAPVEPQWPTARTEPQWPSAPVVLGWRTPPDPADEPEDVDDSRPLAASIQRSPIPPAPAELPSAPPDLPVWPPVGGPATLLVPPVRTPAGAYLAPSAVLPPLDGPNAVSGHGASSAADPQAGSSGKPRVASLAETLDALGITGDVPRRVIGSGAALATFGFLLPWAEIVIGSGQVGSYWARWGLAGPGHWIIVAILIVIAGLGLTRGRLSGLPLGVPAVALGALLVGLVWPYLFGIIGHSVGVWLVLVGAIILAVGGFLDLRRHATATPDV